MEKQCTCIAHKGRVAKAASRLRVGGKGWSAEVILMIMKKTGATFPPIIRNGSHAINELALATMLRSSHDRTLVAKALDEVGERYVGSVGYCPACLKPIPEPKAPKETEAERTERHRQEITEVLQQHPEVSKAEVSVWYYAAGEGLAVGCSYSKTAFDAQLTLTNGSVIPLEMDRPDRRTNKGLPSTVYEYQHKNALWTRIMNRRFLQQPEDRDKLCFPKEEDRRAYETEVLQQYSRTRNIAASCLEVNLLTSKHVTEQSVTDFNRICTSRQRYYCEVITRAPGVNGAPGPVMQLEHVSLRSLLKSSANNSCMHTIRTRFMEMQKRFIQPLADFEWWRQEDGGGKLRRMAGYRVGAGERATMYAFEMSKKPRALSNGMRFFGEPDSGTRYLSLVEICDQQTGALELKWCLTTDHCLKGESGELLSHDLNNLYSVIRRYRSAAGTPKQVASRKKWYFQVVRVIAYCHGDYAVMQRMDTTLKQQTRQYSCDPVERKGMTEFRNLEGLQDCLGRFREEADKVGISCVEPKPRTIDRRLLSSPERVSVDEWLKEVCLKEAE